MSTQPALSADLTRLKTDADAQRRAEHAVAGNRWTTAAKTVLARLIADGETFDAWTLTEQVGTPPRRDLPANVILDARRAGHIERVGYRDHRNGHSGSVIRVWRGTPSGRDHARDYLHRIEAA